jgi:hypothetical protein
MISKIYKINLVHLDKLENPVNDCVLESHSADNARVARQDRRPPRTSINRGQRRSG